METEIWSRKAFDVKAVRVTEENIRDVALWCEGTVAKTLTDFPKLYIALNTVHYNRRHESKAFVGDWIILVDEDFRHYRDRSFKKAYLKKLDRSTQVSELVAEALCCAEDGMTIWAYMSRITDKIVELFEGEGSK